MKTNVGYPYALVSTANGAKLFFLTDVRAPGTTYFGHAMNRHWSKPDWTALYRTRSRGEIQQTDIIRSWREPPHPDTIKAIARAYNRRRA